MPSTELYVSQLGHPKRSRDTEHCHDATGTSLRIDPNNVLVAPTYLPTYIILHSTKKLTTQPYIASQNTTCVTLHKSHTYIHAYIRTYLHPCIHAHVHSFIHTRRQICTHTYMHAGRHPSIHPSIHTISGFCLNVKHTIYKYKYIYIYIYIYIYTYIHTYIYIYIYIICVCMCVSVCKYQRTYIH